MRSLIPLQTLIGLGGLLASLAIAIGIPFVSALHGYTLASNELSVLTRIDASALVAAGLSLDDLEKRQAEQLGRSVAFFDPVKRSIRWTIVDQEGKAVARGGSAIEWPSIERAVALPANPRGLAALQLAMSLRPLVIDLGLLTALCAMIGIGLGMAMRAATLPLLDRILAEQKAENLRFHTAIDNISQGVCFFDGRQRLIVCNRRYAEMYHLTQDLVRPGTTLREIVDFRFSSGCSPEMTRGDYLAWRRTISISNERSDTVVTLRNGKTFAIHHQPMPDGGWVATHEDITERKRAVEQIERMAHYDSLTGLPNRVLFRARLNEEIARSTDGDSLAVLCIDLDRFKTVNDTLGHPLGDQLLRCVAQRLCECVRQTDLVVRLGGDEFAIIQTRAPQPAAAQSLARRLVRVMATPFEIEGHRVLVGASVGVAFSPDDGLDSDDLLRNSDLALYGAKAAGGGTYRMFQTQMGEMANSRRSMEIDLQRAAENGELELHYQPIIALGNQGGRGHRQVVGFEALLRWRHPVRGMVMPDCFIPLAEETGLIEPIGEWVLNKAFGEAVRWPAHVGVAVNLSPQQLRNGNLVGVVSEALRRSGLAANRVDLEITESVLLAENSINVAILHELRELGVRISLDDFGVGYSSLSYLRSFPFKKIKIDRSFIRDVASNSAAIAIVKAIAILGNSLGMVVTAEGVEAEEQLACLQALHCDEAQGYLMSPPRPACDIDEMLRVDRRLTLVAAAG